MGKDQRTETGLKSVAFAQVRWIPASSEQRLCAEEQGEKLDLNQSVKDRDVH